jgi:hypothetical protein
LEERGIKAGINQIKNIGKVVGRERNKKTGINQRGSNEREEERQEKETERRTEKEG